MKKKDILYDHYKDTFAYLREYIKNRDKYFFYTIILILLLSIQINDADFINDIVKTLSKEKIDYDLSLNMQIINTVFLFGLLSLIIKYFQVNILIDKQYDYLNSLEIRINEKYGEELLTREGKYYVTDYPLVKELIHIIYTLVFPFLILAYSIYRMVKSISVLRSQCDLFPFVDISISVVIIILTFLYLSWIQFNDFRKSNNDKNKNNCFL